MSATDCKPERDSGVVSSAGLCRWYWLTTAPNPKSPATGFDAGQRGWKRHAVWAKESATVKDVRFVQALCGLTPAHGWGDDLFIEAKCERCERLMAKRHNAGAQRPPT